MKLLFEDKNTLGQLTLSFQETALFGQGTMNDHHSTINTIVWNTRSDQTVTIDSIPYVQPANSILPLVAKPAFYI